jgi:ribosomal protein L10
MMNKEQKKQYISDMTNQFEKSEAVIVTHYQGLTMNQLDDLRAKMREHGIKFKITNNRITKLALEKTKCKDGNIGVSIGNKSFSNEKLIMNFNAITDALDKEKTNNTLKGDLIKQAFITSTMGVSYKVKLEKSI